MLAKVGSVLEQDEDITDDYLDSNLCHNVKWWSKRVHRIIFPPSVLYWRVRAVLVFYGDKRDAVTGKHLFNDRAWLKSKKCVQVNFNR